MPETTLAAGQSVLIQLAPYAQLTIFGIGDGSLINRTNNAPMICVKFGAENGDDITIVKPAEMKRAFLLECVANDLIYTTDPFDVNFDLSPLVSPVTGEVMGSPLTDEPMRRP